VHIRADGQMFISSNCGSWAPLLRRNKTGEPETVWKGKSM
jgi:hypothetical protein